MSTQPFTESFAVTDAGTCPNCRKNTWVIEMLTDIRIEISCLHCGYRWRIIASIGMQGEIKQEPIGRSNG